jgi:hypothetical protein
MTQNRQTVVVKLSSLFSSIVVLPCGALSVCLHRSASKYLSRLLVVYIYSTNLGFGNQMLDFQVSVTNTLNSLMITIHHHFTLCTDLLGTLRVSTRLLLLTSRISLLSVRLSLFMWRLLPEIRVNSLSLVLPNAEYRRRPVVVPTSPCLSRVTCVSCVACVRLLSTVYNCTITMKIRKIAN